MSKAFTRDENEGPEIPDLPPLVSALPEGARNYITAEGAQQLREELSKLAERRAAFAARGAEDAEAKRQLALLDQRGQMIEESLQSAEVVEPPTGEAARVVRFGATVLVRDAGTGEETIYRIVGVDEIDLEQNWVSWVSPIAQALLETRPGEVARFQSPAGEQKLEVVAVHYE